MAEPREFYYPLQDEAANIDRVLHDLVEITNTEESLDMYVKVIEVEGQPHFWFGEGGEKQKPIEVDEWELPVGDGQDWVRKSHIYTPCQVGEIMEENLSQDQLDLAVVFTKNVREYVQSGDPPISTVNTFIRKVGMADSSKIYDSGPQFSPYYFGNITETIFNNLFNDSESISLSVYTTVDISPSVSSYTKFYLCDIIYDENSNSYNVFLTYNEQTYKIANISYESETKRIVIERFYNNNYGSLPEENYYQRPPLKLLFSYKNFNGNPFNFNYRNYYFACAADDAPYNIQIPAETYWEVKPDISISSTILEDESQFSPTDWLSTDMAVKAGIYSIGIKPEKHQVDLLYIGPLNDNLGQASKPSGDTIGITLKQGGNLSFERTIFDCQDGKVYFKGGHIDLNAEGDLPDDDPNSRGWDGTRGGDATNEMRSGEPLIVMHGDPLLQMLHESTLHLIEGASIEMDGETLLSLHDLTKIDMSGAPYIQIHGTDNKSDGDSLKYNIPNRQPYITIDDGSTISMSGAAGDPFLFLKGACGIVFNNNHGYNAIIDYKGPYRGAGKELDPINEKNGPLIMVNEDGLYFDGFGTEGVVSHTPKINPLNLSMDSLNKYRDKDWEEISQQISKKGYADYSQKTENIISKIMNIGSEDPILWQNTLDITSYYAKSVGEEFEQYILDNDKFSLVESLRKFYYLRVNAYNVVDTIVNALTDYPEIQLKNDIYIEILVGHDLYGQTPVEEEFERQGLNIDDYIVGVAYHISSDSDLFSSFTTYYNNKYATTQLPLANIVYKQKISDKRETFDFLNLYYGKSLSDFSEDYNSDYFTMQLGAYEEIENYFLDYNNNKNNVNYYYTIDNDHLIVQFIQKRFQSLVEEYYRKLYPCFQERVHASNSIVILGGDTGSTSWIKVGGSAGEQTRVGVLNNSQLWMQDASEINMSNSASLNISEQAKLQMDQSSEIRLSNTAKIIANVSEGIIITNESESVLSPYTTRFSILPATSNELMTQNPGIITFADGHTEINFTIDDLRQALNGGGGGGASTYKEEILWNAATSTDTQGEYTLSKSFTDFDAICFKVNWRLNSTYYKLISTVPSSILEEEIGTGAPVEAATGNSQYFFIQVLDDNTFVLSSHDGIVDVYQDTTIEKIIGIKYGISASSLDGVGL